MASIRKLTSGKWNVRVSRQGYPLQAKSFINRTDADKWARTIEAEMDRGCFVCRNEAESTTLGEALKRYINNRFVYYFTLTPGFIEQAGLHARTAAQPKLALSRLSTIKLGIPSFSEQERLADAFDALREETQHLEALYQRKLAALDALKKSLLHQAFSGAL